MGSSVLCIGSAVVDIAASPISQHALWREKQRISDISLHAGGDAANQSMMLALMGNDAYLVGGIGPDENGFYLRSILEARGVRTELVKVKENCRTGAALILVDECGERRVFSVRGAFSDLDKTDCPDLSDPKLAGIGAVSIASFFDAPAFERDGMKDFLKNAQAHGILTFADLGNDKEKKGLAGIREFLPHLDYFLPSIYDAVEMTGKTDPRDAAGVYLDCGAKHVVIKCGAEGCYCRSAETESFVPAVTVQTLDTTGAGDAMVALFIHEVLCGSEFLEACRRACAGASYTTLFSGASPEAVTREDLLSWIEAHTQEQRPV